MCEYDKDSSCNIFYSYADDGNYSSSRPGFLDFPLLRSVEYGDVCSHAFTIDMKIILTCLLTFGRACSRPAEQMRASFRSYLIAALAVLGLNTACGQGNFENRRTQQEQNGARSSYALQGGERQYVNTDVQGFAELVADTNVVVLDVRTATEFAEGHLERAINIDYHQSDFVEKAKATLPLDKKIAVYCRSGRRSAGAAGKLGEDGYKLVNLKGGIIAWKEANMPVTTK